MRPKEGDLVVWLNMSKPDRLLQRCNTMAARCGCNDTMLWDDGLRTTISPFNLIPDTKGKVWLFS